jgi:hypothetical protein
MRRSRISGKQKEKPLASGMFVLHKYPGKGGWTYAEIPTLLPGKKNPFGWVQVSGFIDSYELKNYKLMPMGQGHLFLPVKAQIRKSIGKQAGDQVRVLLYRDDSPLEIPAEIRECFATEPAILFKTFTGFTMSEQKAYLDWIFSAKKEDNKSGRIVMMMKRLEKDLRLHDPE